MIGHLRPAAQPGDHLLAVHVRQAKIEDDKRRRGGRRRLQGVGAVQRLHDVVAGGFERRAQKALDLRLVVDDEDALAAHASSGGCIVGRR